MSILVVDVAVCLYIHICNCIYILICILINNPLQKNFVSFHQFYITVPVLCGVQYT